MDTSLAGPNAKLNRAREHLTSFAHAHHEYFRPRPFDMHKVYDAQSGWYSFLPVLLREPPLRLGVILGDLVHNLRSALDHLVWEAVSRNGAKPTKDHQFPFCEQESAWPAAAAKRLKDMAADDLEAIRTVQPFTVTLKPTPLTRLRTISNEDKHHIVPIMLPAVASAHRVTYIVTPPPPDMRLLPRRDVGELHQTEVFVGVPLDGSVPLVRVKITASGPDPDIDLEGQMLSDLMLEDGGLVRHVINDMATSVEHIVNGFGRRWTATAGSRYQNP